MANFVKKRLSVHQRWSGDIPLKNLWGVQFSSRSGSGSMKNIGEDVDDILQVFSPHTFDSFSDHVGIFDKVSDSEAGMLLAQSVAMPQETFSTSTVGSQNVGGFLQAPIGGQRSAPSKLSIGFLETNIDIFSNFIKPWMVAASFKGLIEDDREDIKCNIDIMQFSRSKRSYSDKVESSNSGEVRAVDYGLRKMTTFFDCVPTNMVEDRMSYGEIGFEELMREVDFIYSHYVINTP